MKVRYSKYNNIDTAVLISIQSVWCNFIAHGEKSIELRKSVPALKPPFKCYIYCTQAQPYFLMRDNDSGIYDMVDKNEIDVWNRKQLWNGHIIGEFICDMIEPIACHKCFNGVGFDYIYYTESLDTLTNETSLTEYDMQQYFGHAEDGECVGYAWHIFNLKIYNKPKELEEFFTTCHKLDNDKCGDCPHLRVERCSYPCDDSIDVWCGVDNKKPITRPPQSWCYINKLVE